MPEKNWSPAEYDKQSVLQYKTAMKMLEDLTLDGHEEILDVGCGSGKISAELARRVPEGNVIGLDRNESMIQFANDKYRTDNLSFECQDIVTMSYDRCFDAVVSFWTLSWVPMEHQATALENISNSLKENGRLLLMYPMRHDAYDVVDLVIQKPEWRDFFVNYPPPRQFITEEYYREEIINHMPMEMHVEKKELACHYTNDKEMRDSINCWLRHVGC